MIVVLPENVTPTEASILRIYLTEETNPQQIAVLLHYKQPSPVYRVLRKYRNFLSSEGWKTRIVTI